MSKRESRLYLVLLHFLVAALSLKAFMPSWFETEAHLKELRHIIHNLDFNPETPLDVARYRSRILRYHKIIDKFIESSTTLFIGDSMIQGLYVNSVVMPAVNYGVGRDTSSGVLERLGVYENSLMHAKQVILAVGINDFRTSSHEEILHNMNMILDKISIKHKKTVILNALHPIDESLLKGRAYLSNEAINDFNEKLQQLCSNFYQCHYLSIYEKLLNENGSLDEKNHTGDGIHLSPRGYRIWINAMKQKIKKLQESN